MIKRALTLVNAMHITASVYIHDDERGLLSDYEKWLEELAPHAPPAIAGPEAGCTTAPAKLASGRPLSREERGNNADAHLKRKATRSVARDGPPSEAVVAVTKGRLDFGTWERIFSGQAEWLARES